MRAALILALALVTGEAQASTCQAPLPHKGATFAGKAQHVHDGDTLCIGPGSDPRTWIAVRMADFYAPETYEPGGWDATQALERITGGQWITCTAGKRSYERIVAHCTIHGRDLGDLMRDAGIAEGGRGWHGVQ